MSRIGYLDGIRGLLALSVCANHILGGLENWSPDRPFVGAYLAVDYFFILSGFVLSLTLDKKPVSQLTFLKKRFLRLFPLLFITVILCFIIYYNNKLHGAFYPAENKLSWRTFLENIFFLSSTGLVKTGMINDPAWSIGIEFWVSSILLYWIFRMKNPIIFLISIAAYITLYYMGGNGLQLAPQPFLFTNLGALRGLAGMSLGAFLYKNRETLRLYMGYIPIIIRRIILLLCAIGIGITQYYGATGLGDFSALLLIIPFFIMPKADADKDCVLKVLNSRAGCYLGELSFPVYLIHTPVIIFLLPPSYMSHWGFYGAFSYAMSFSIASAILVNYLLKQGLNKLQNAAFRNISN